MKISEQKTKLVKWIGIFALLFASFLAWKAINPLMDNLLGLTVNDNDCCYDPAIVFCNLPEAVEASDSMYPYLGCGFYLKEAVMSSEDSWNYYCDRYNYEYTEDGVYASICEEGNSKWIG